MLPSARPDPSSACEGEREGIAVPAQQAGSLVFGVESLNPKPLNPKPGFRSDSQRA